MRLAPRAGTKVQQHSGMREYETKFEPDTRHGLVEIGVVPHDGVDIVRGETFNQSACYPTHSALSAATLPSIYLPLVPPLCLPSTYPFCLMRVLRTFAC